MRQNNQPKPIPYPDTGMMIVLNIALMEYLELHPEEVNNIEALEQWIIQARHSALLESFQEQVDEILSREDEE